jgi:predicted RNA-binding Zn-ribbon protein involved in translation (DUF1610 family)
MDRSPVLGSTGLAALVVALVFFMLQLFVSGTRGPILVSLSYVLLFGGSLLLALDWLLRSIQHHRQRDWTLRCPECGWNGPGRTWIRHTACPDCESSSAIRTD